MKQASGEFLVSPFVVDLPYGCSSLKDLGSSFAVSESGRTFDMYIFAVDFDILLIGRGIELSLTAIAIQIRRMDCGVMPHATRRAFVCKNGRDFASDDECDELTHTLGRHLASETIVSDITSLDDEIYHQASRRLWCQ